MNQVEDLSDAKTTAHPVLVVIYWLRALIYRDQMYPQCNDRFLLAASLLAYSVLHLYSGQFALLSCLELYGQGVELAARNQAIQKMSTLRQR